MELTIRNTQPGSSTEDILEVTYTGNRLRLNFVYNDDIYLSPEEAAVLAEVLKQYSEKWGEKRQS